MYIDFLLSLSDFAVQGGLTHLRDRVRNLLKLLPTGQLCTRKANQCKHGFLFYRNENSQ